MLDVFIIISQNIGNSGAKSSIKPVSAEIEYKDCHLPFEFEQGAFTNWVVSMDRRTIRPDTLDSMENHLLGIMKASPVWTTLGN